MEAYFTQWVIEEERLLNDLLAVPPDRPDLHIPLISRTLSHYAEYYNRKSQLADQDVFQVLSGYWLTPFERSFLWMGGLLPRAIFQLVPSELDGDQRGEIEQLKEQTAGRVRELEGRMHQVEDARMVLIALAVVHGNARNGEVRAAEAQRVADMTRAVFGEAERLRKHVVITIIDTLHTAQTLRFLAAVADLHLWARRVGLHQTAPD